MITLENSKEKIGREVNSSRFLPLLPVGKADAYFRGLGFDLAYKVTASNTLDLYELHAGEDTWVLTQPSQIALHATPLKIAAAETNGRIVVVAKFASGSKMYFESLDATSFAVTDLTQVMNSFVLSTTSPEIDHPNDIDLWAIEDAVLKKYSLSDNFSVATTTNIVSMASYEIIYAGFNRKFEFQLNFKEIDV